MWNYSSQNMTGRNWFFNILFPLLIIICSAISQCSSALSDTRLCYNPDCSEPVSLAKTIVNYAAIEKGLLSFNRDTVAKVYSKESGKRTDLWGVEINGKRGYVPKSFLREFQILHKDLKYIVPTKPLVTNNDSSHKLQNFNKSDNKSLFDAESIEASIEPIDNLNLQSTPKLSQKEIHLTPPYEVVDGTTVHLNQDEQTKLVPEAIEPTVLPNKQHAVNDSGIGLPSGNIESNIFTDSDKVPEVALTDKVEKLKQKVSDNVNINDFVTSSEQVLNLPEVTGIQIKSLDKNTVSDSIEHKTENTKDEKKAPAFNQVIENNVTGSVIPVENKHTLNIERGAVVSSNKQNNLSLSEAVKHNNTISNIQNGKSNDKIETQASKSEAIVSVNSTTTNVPHTTRSDKIEIKDVQSAKSETIDVIIDVKSDTQNANNSETSKINEAQSSKSEAIDVISDVKSDTQEVNSSDTSETKEVQSPKSEAIAVTSNINLDTQKANSSDITKTKEAQSSKTEAIVVTSDVKSDTQKADSSETLKTNEAQSSKSETIDVISDVKSDTHDANNSDISETKEVQSPKNEAVAATSNIKLDTQEANSSDIYKTKEAQSSKTETIVATSDVKSDTQKADSSETLKTNEAESSKSKTIDVISDVKSDTQDANNSDISETKEVQSPTSEAVAATSNIKLDTQEANSSDVYKTKEAQSSKTEAIVATSDIKSDTRKADSSERLETKDTQSSETTKEAAPFVENLTTTITNDSTSGIQSEESFGKIEPKDTNISKSIAVDINNNTETAVGSIDIIGTIDEKTSQFVESITDTSDTKDVKPSKNIVQLTTEKIESQNGNEYNKNNKYMLPLFLQLSAKNKVSKIVPSDNIEAATQNTENISGHNVNNMQDDSNIEDTALTIETAPKIEPVVNIVDSVSVDETILDVQSSLNAEDSVSVEQATSQNIIDNVQVSPPGVCTANSIECSAENNVQNDFPHHDIEDALMEGIYTDSNYWMTLMYLSVTAIATIIFSLGYYWIENMRRDRQLIARINKLEKDLLISEAELTMVNENLKSTREKLNRMEDESFGSDEMVLSLRADLESLQNVKVELEDQVLMLEKDLESATEAGLELEKMLREVLSANNEVNPLAQSVEDLQTRLNAQQSANESLTNALSLKTQELEFDKLENESLLAELLSVKRKYEELEVELTRVTENLRLQVNNKNSMEQTLNNKVQQLEMQIKEISTEKTALQKELKDKEVEASDLIEVINKLNSNNLDLDKLYDVSHIKAEATALLEERNELKIRLAEVEGAYNLLEEHVKVVKEEIATLSEQCKAAEKEKKDAETRLEVLTNFFEEKEAQRQKEEAIWLQQQGEVVSTVERIQMLQNEIQNYKQQVEMLKREILDQEREYKGQISLLETKAHEQWVIARQVERHLEESKVEAGQLRNRLTLIEKNLNDVDSEAKLHRLAANGETTSSPPLFVGGEPCNYPIMFSGSTSGPLPPPPSYLHSLFPPYLPPPLPNVSEVPPYEVNQRPPPLGGRLSSPPPMPPLHQPASNRYDNAVSLPRMSPHLLPPPLDHRSPLPPYSSEMYPPPPPPPGSILPPSLGAPRSWGEESLPPLRNSGFHPAQRERVRNHKGSLHSSGESLDKSHHSKV